MSDFTFAGLIEDFEDGALIVDSEADARDFCYDPATGEIYPYEHPLMGGDEFPF